MKAWLVQIGETLPLNRGVRKMRTAHLADRLVSRGHTVVWWGSSFDHKSKKIIAPGDAVFEVAPRQTIRVMRALGYSKNVSLRRYISHRLLAARFRKLARSSPRPDVIVAATPDHHLAFEVVRYAREAGIPVLVDVRDMWPDWFLDALPFGFLRGPARLALVQDFSRLRWLVQHADGLVASAKLYLSWALSCAGRARGPHDRLFYLGARPVPSIQTLKLSADYRAFLEQLDGKFVVSFIGSFGAYYNPTIIARAARYLVRQAHDSDRFRFVIAGNGVMHDEVVREARGVPIVEMTGWLGDDEIFALLHRSSIGIIPTGPNADAVPNKLFTYMSAGLPLVSSLEGEVRALIEQKNVGYTYIPDDERSLARAVVQLAEQPHLVDEMSRNAKRLFESDFHANRIYDSYADHVQRIARKH